MGRVMMLLYIREQVDEKSSREREELGGGGVTCSLCASGKRKRNTKGTREKNEDKKVTAKHAHTAEPGTK